MAVTVKQVLIQVLAGLVVVYVVYRMSLWVLKKDKLVVDVRSDFDPRRETAIISGYVPTDLVVDRQFNTLNPRSQSFRSLPRSFNRKGGAQFSYSFWLYMKNTEPTNVANKTILLRGDRSRFAYQRTMVDRSTDVDKLAGGLGATTDSHYDEVLVKCPLIRFGEDYKSFVVEFNTLDRPDEKVEIKSFDSTSDDPSMRHNVLKLIDNAWVLLTFTFEDNVSINDFEDGIVMRFYVNDFLYNTAKVKSALYQNNGNLHLFPTWDSSGAADGRGIRDARIADLKYWNYALGAPSISELYKQGPSKHYATDLVGSDDLGDPLYLSMYNKIDIYNS